MSVDFIGDGDMIQCSTRDGRHVASLGALCNDAVSDVTILISTAQLFQTIKLNAKQPEGLSSHTGNNWRHLRFSQRC